jgi:hypothetical protein
MPVSHKPDSDNLSAVMNQSSSIHAQPRRDDFPVPYTDLVHCQEQQKEDWKALVYEDNQPQVD